MARGLRYIAKRIRQITILTIGSAVFFALCLASLSLAEGESGSEVKAQERVVVPAQVMQILMAPAGSPIDGCLLPVDLPKTERCRAFFNVDDEKILENLLQNYTECLDGHSYYYDFSNQPVVRLTKPLEIYGRTDEPLIIRGLKLAPGETFPKGSPAIAVFGKAIGLNDVQIDGFDTGILSAADKGSQHRVAGGEIRGSANAGRAILSCQNPPLVDGTVISGFHEDVSVIE